MKWSEAKEKADDRVWADLELRPTGKIETKEQYEYVIYYESHIFQKGSRRIAEIPFEQAQGKYLRLGDYFGGADYYFYLDDKPDGKDMEYDSKGNPKGFLSYYDEFNYGKFGKIEFETKEDTMPEYRDYYTSKGYYVIGENIYAVDSFINNHQKTIDDVIEWANKEDVFVEFGCLKNGQAYCRYHLGCKDKYAVAALEGVLDYLLKSEFPSRRKHILSLPIIIATNKIEN